MVISTIANIANRDQVSTYLSQVIENHPASTELSMPKHHFDPGPTWVRYKVEKEIIMQQGCHSNAYHLMQQYITIVN